MSDYSVRPPEGWVSVPESLFAAQLADLRAQPNMKAAELVIYISPGQDATLSIIRTEMKMAMVTRETVTELDRGIAAGSREAATKHISDSRQFVGDRLIGTSVDENGADLVKQLRVVIADGSNVAHTLAVVCAGKPDKLADCERAQESMTFSVPNTVNLSTQTTSTGQDVDYAYQAGRVCGVLLVVALVIWAIKKIAKHA